MRTSFLTLFFLCVGVLAARSAPPMVDGAWVLSDKWRGYMGLALVINGDEFRYWFMSDFKSEDEPTYPITGKVEFVGGVIRLHSIGDARLYDTDWHLVVLQGEICLLADTHMRAIRDGQRFPDDRLLHKVEHFDENSPTMNRPKNKE
jgi:hypothetical protein